MELELAPSEPPQKKPFMLILQEKMAESRFLTFSLMLHTVLILLLGSVVLFKKYIAPPDFAPDGPLLGSETAAPPAAAAEPEPVADTQTVSEPTVTAPTVSAIVSTSTQASSFTMASAPMPTMKSIGESKPGSISTTMGSGAGKSFAGAMGGRAGGKRAAAAKATGGTEEAEKAVMAGLRWLVKNQSADGSWGPANQSAMTGLAMLCFLGHGELQESQEFGPTVKKGLDWLLQLGSANNGKMVVGGNWGQPGVYEHGIATYAMGEYYTMTKDERFLELLKKSVGYIVDGQAPDGGWQYGYAKAGDSDTSVSGWQVQALKAAHLTELKLPGVDTALDKSVLNMKRVQGPKGGFGYRTPVDKYSMSGVGVLCTYFWTQDKQDKAVKNGIEYIIEESEKNFPVVYKDPKADLYAWYYHTQACLMFGGPAWTKWNKMFQHDMVVNQSSDGSWPPTGGAAGHLGANLPGGIGPFYRTTLCVLMLEVFYRYSPTLK